MAATVIIQRATGPAGSLTLTNITSINTVVNQIDQHQSVLLGSASPIPVPALGVNYSFWCSTRLNVTAPPANIINNLRWYTDGSNNFGSGIACVGQSANQGADAGYRQATSAIQLNVLNHTGLSAAPVDVFSFVAGSPKLLNGSQSSTGPFGDYFVYQIQVTPTADPGLSGQEAFIWSYDET